MNSKLITPESPLLVPPRLAAEIGVYEALILQQIHYHCLSSKHVKQDGRRWFWKTLADWALTMPFLKPSTIRRAIANLKNKFKLIDVERHSQKTWYQANWFTVNVENLQALWDSICQKQQIDMPLSDTSMCANPIDHIRDFPTKTYSPQQQPAAEAQENEPDWGGFSVDGAAEEIDWDEIAKKIAESEASQLAQETEQSNYAEAFDNKLDYTTNTQDPREGHFPALGENDNKNQKMEFKASLGFELPDQAIESSMTPDEMRDITNQLRAIACTPAFRVNPQVQDCIRKNWGNVQNAIAYLKEQIAANVKPKKSWEAWFVFAVTSGLKPEKGCVPTNFKTWFEKAYKKGLVVASERRADGVVGVCLSVEVASSLGVNQWVRYEKAIELLSQVQI